MYRLSKHVRCNESDALFGYVEPPPVFFAVHPDGQAGWQPTVLVDHRTLEHDMAADVHVGQDDRLFDRALTVDVHAREKQRAV